MHVARRVSSPFHIALLSSKIAVCVMRKLEIRTTHAYFLQLSKNFCSGHQLPIGTTPLPAERRHRIKPLQNDAADNKKPGVERRANPSTT
jgi:hypothetical protein